MGLPVSHPHLTTAYYTLTTVGLVAGGAAGPFNLPLSDLGSLTLLAVLGVAARHARRTAAAREDAARDHIPRRDWPTLDLSAMVIDFMTAPLLGPGAYAMVKWKLQVPDYAFAAVIIGAGYWGPVILRSAGAFLQGILAKFTGTATTK